MTRGCPRSPLAPVLLGLLALTLLVGGCSFDADALNQPPCTDDECGDADTDPSELPSDGTSDESTGDDADTDTPRVCTPGEARCEGNTRVVCNPAGDRYLELDCARAVHCPAGADACICEDGLCVAETCTPGETRCDGDTLLACDNEGVFMPVEDCGDTASGRCVADNGPAGCERPATCSAGETRCAAQREAIERCNDGGDRFLTDETCTPAEYCDDAACVPVACPPGSTTCADDTTLLLCDDRGTAGTEEPCAAGLVCAEDDDGARCDASLCAPDSLRCGPDGNVQRCDEDGDAWQLDSTCATGETCSRGECVERVCVPFTVRCADDGSREICAADGLEHDPLPCGEGETCAEGTCRERVCEPGPFCDSSGNARLCNPSGSASTVEEVCAFGCEEGECQPSICGDGIVDAEGGETCDVGDADAFCTGCEDCRRLRQLRMTSQTRTTGFSRWEPDRSDVTLSAWVRPEADSGWIAGVGNPQSGDYLGLGFVDRKPAFVYRTNSSTTITAAAPSAVPLDRWVHVAGVRFQERGVALYVNGVRVAGSAPRSSGGTRINDDDRIWIGARSSGDVALAGRVASVHLERTARHRSNRFFPARFPTSTDATVALYTFHSASGGTIPDVSGNGRGLTVAEAQLVADDCFGFTASARCGDGLRAPWEQCDPADPEAPADCTSSCTSPSACDGEVGPDGACYLLSLDRGDQNYGRQQCAAWGGHLARVPSAEVETWLRQRMGGTYWIGLFTRNNCNTCNDRTFEWVDGGAVTYTNWASGEPNNFGLFSAEDCVLSGSGGWNDVRCREEERYVCRK